MTRTHSSLTELTEEQEAATVTPSDDPAAPRRRWWQARTEASRIWRQPVVVVALLVAGAWLVVAIAAPLLAPFDPLQQSSDVYASPGGDHLFGTDALGRDVLSRVIYGARLSIPLALTIVLCALAFGGLLGLVAGYVRGIIGESIMRLTDLFFAFPQIILAMAVAAAFGPSTLNAVVALVIVSWPIYARVIRGAVLSIRSEDYLNASRMLGVGPVAALRRDVMPNSFGPAVVLATLELGNSMLLLAALSFLGLGPRPPAAEWGAMIALGTNDISRWWVSVFPGLAILTVVMACNIIGDALRDRFDPQSVGGR
ncbi:ABC transporter permease [Blastococcus sp. VKM Ac-2987]|uniref:ABC transporter permease n=1 Tax=Blastococcus sp. VKM Ac-2987 TaxID=3004141 RepID=UPI0022AB7189|nr:ABC transporter permease [Blastococcus sp. VKM Ac-2987]MCZ2857574.1 ABC transporter permease [Blastococcus sp. VKM Ac-2987]